MQAGRSAKAYLKLRLINSNNHGEPEFLARSFVRVKPFPICSSSPLDESVRLADAARAQSFSPARLLQCAAVVVLLHSAAQNLLCAAWRNRSQSSFGRGAFMWRTLSSTA